MQRSSFEIVSESVEQTLSLGSLLGRYLPIGTLVSLNGSLGAGKTHLTKGVASGLGIPDTRRVHSPTFTLLTLHRGGRLPLFHMDFYRIAEGNELPHELVEAIEGREGVSVVEWADRFPELTASHVPRVDVALDVVNENARRLKLTLHGIDDSSLSEALAELT